MPNEESKLLSTMALAIRHGISVRTIETWRKYENFPHDASTRIGFKAYWEADKVDQWLRNRLDQRAAKKTSGASPVWENFIRQLT